MALSFFDYLETELERAGFFRPKSKQPVMRRNLRNLFHRMQLTEQDVSSLRGMVVRLVEGPRTGGERNEKPREACPDEDE
jgi:tRNA/rRNA methyltransferase